MPESKIDQDESDQISTEFEEIYTDASNRIEKAQEAFWGYFEGKLSFEQLVASLYEVELKHPFSTSLRGLSDLEKRYRDLGGSSKYEIGGNHENQ